MICEAISNPCLPAVSPSGMLAIRLAGSRQGVLEEEEEEEAEDDEVVVEEGSLLLLLLLLEGAVAVAVAVVVAEADLRVGLSGLLEGVEAPKAWTCCASKHGRICYMYIIGRANTSLFV